MILKREFYFVRHGQTDHNFLEGLSKGNHAEETPLNRTGREQAALIEPIIALLPVQAICTSPMKRAQETKDIITKRLQIPHYEINDLGECTSNICKGMKHLGMYSSLPIEGEIHLFMQRVRHGINHALSLPGPPLIVAHGGVHWAICCLLEIATHEWSLENCGIVYFSVDTNGKWTAKKLTQNLQGSQTIE